MNEMASLAERSGVDIDVVRECVGSDPRIGLDYLYPGCGYGGRALSENVEKISAQLQLRSDDLGLLNVVTKINERQKDLLFRKIWNYFESNLNGKVIAVWGASFKPGSSSINGAPAVRLIESHLAQKGKIRVYDPLAKEALQSYFGNQLGLVIANSSREAIEGADVLAICTEWKEFWSPDFDLLKNSLIEKAIFDGRNILDPAQVKKRGLRYLGIGRGEQV
jgi:UDPglucose 6-dehydrogenase